MRPVYFYLVIVSSLVSCVSTGKFKAMQQEAQKNDSLYTWSQRTLKTCQGANNDLSKQKMTLQNQTNELNQQLSATKENNTQMRKQLRDLSAITSAQAESIKKSLDNMGAKDMYLQDLRAAVSHRDSMNMVVVLNLKAAIGGFGDQDVSIKLENGVVHVDLSDRLLFNSDSNSSNSYTVTNKAKTVLGRMARALNDMPDVEFMVEGHTDGIVPHKDSIAVRMDSVALQTDTVIVHMDSTVAHTDTAVVHMDSAVARIDSAGTRMDTATVHTDSALVHTDAIAVHTDSAVAHTDTPVVHMDSAVARIDSAGTRMSNPAAHTDSVPVHVDTVPAPQSVLVDNWDLSVKRATSIVRILQNDYHVSPARMIASGRSEYISVAPNDTPEGQAANRRTRIIILPQLNQLLRVLEHRQGQGESPVQVAPAAAPAPAVSGS
jgi:flagellar motor protein MotB